MQHQLNAHTILAQDVSGSTIFWNIWSVAFTLSWSFPDLATAVTS